MKRAIFMIMLLALCGSCGSRESSATIKRSNLAGQWYSADRTELSRSIDRLLARPAAVFQRRDPLILVLPHAGYAYSGGIAAAGYRALGTVGKPAVTTDLVVILGPSHYSAFSGCALIDADYYETPLGRVRLERGVAERLGKNALFRHNPSMYEREHSIEIHLPFLQRIFGSAIERDISVLPVLVGELDDREAARAAGAIAAAVAGKHPLFIISSDFTHYGPRFGYMPFKNETASGTAQKLKKVDRDAIEFILKRDIAGFSSYVERTGITICGRNPIKIAMALPIEGPGAEIIAYDTSGAITGDYENSVSYASIIFYGRLAGSAGAAAPDTFALAEQDRLFLLRAARDNIRSWLEKKRGIRFFPTDVPKTCLEKRGVFVTLKKKGALRGCIGYIVGTMPLIQGVLDASYNAAFRDPRFGPLGRDELKEIAIEISVLTAPVPVRSVKEIQTGRDGLIVERGRYRGLLLPQVAVEQGWGPERFLDETCLKAGLPAGAWKDGITTVSRFQAIVFGEEAK
ncbi:MAG: AmmeMemoRadiSam system protein B [Spirochaetes bacterium]|nr:AmmeMemoRadiSam system protein B [Spirochaetota bacterium]